MKSVQINDAASTLNELVEHLSSLGDVLITRGDQPVARLTTADEKHSLREIQPSSLGGILRPLFGENDDLLAEMLN